MKKRILLIGGNGFIGKNIRESYLAKQYDIIAPTSKELNLSDSDAVDLFFKDHSFDAVIHSAAKPGHRNAPDLTGIFYTNSRMFFNLVKHADSCGRILNIGSGAIYDMQHYQPKMPETYFGTYIPVDEHGFNKYVCGKYMEVCSEDIVDLRVFGIFGKDEDYAIRFISNVICKTLFDLPITLRQDRMFDYLYVADLMQVLEYFIENKPRYKAYNITPDTTVSLYSLAMMIKEIAKKDLPIIVAEEGMGLEYSGNNKRLHDEVVGLSFTSTFDAVQALYHWYSDNKSSIDKNLLLIDK